MKKLLLLTLFYLPLLSMSSEIKKAASVYICTGPKASVYHSSNKCRGLNRCSGDVKEISLADAKKNGTKSL